MNFHDPNPSSRKTKHSSWTSRADYPQHTITQRGLWDLVLEMLSLIFIAIGIALFLLIPVWVVGIIIWIISSS